MVGKSTYSMVSALQGLQRMESQLSHALRNAGEDPAPVVTKSANGANVQDQFNKEMTRASLVLNNVNMLA